jgi:hypothetical protein
MLLSAVIGMLVVSACADPSTTSSTGGQTTDAAPTQPTLAPSGSSSPSPSATTVEGTQGSAPVGSDQIDPGLKPFIDIAVADLAKRLSIDPIEVAVTSATLEVWSDSSLGCPQPGQSYAQVATDGSKIVLTANGKTYSYHAGGSTKPFLCELTSKATPITGLTTP